MLAIFHSLSKRSPVDELAALQGAMPGHRGWSHTNLVKPSLIRKDGNVSVEACAACS